MIRTEYRNRVDIYDDIFGRLHSFNDEPARVYHSGRKAGRKEWYKNGQIHRDNGPALIGIDGTKCWYKNNELHREDGPAIEWSDGVIEYYINGKCLTKKEFNSYFLGNF